MESVNFTIPKISCMHCVHTIKMELGELEGILSVDVSAETKKATIKFDDPTTEELIVALLREINYPPGT